MKSWVVMVKVRANLGNRTDILNVASMFQANVIDVTPESMIIEAAGDEEKLDSLVELLGEFGARLFAEARDVVHGEAGGRVVLAERKAAVPEVVRQPVDPLAQTFVYTFWLAPALIAAMAAALGGREAAAQQVQECSAGGNHTCVVQTDGSPWCWGQNDAGQLGVREHAVRGPKRKSRRCTTASSTLPRSFARASSSGCRPTTWTTSAKATLEWIARGVGYVSNPVRVLGNNPYPIFEFADNNVIE